MSAAHAKPRRRWFQFSLRALLMVVTLFVGLLVAWRAYVEPYRRQRETMKRIEELGGEYSSERADKWLRRLYGDDFQNVVLVDLADCNYPEDYLDQVAALPQLETLVVGGLLFTDEELDRLKEVDTLRGLVLDTTNVTDDGIAALKLALPELAIHKSHRRSFLEFEKVNGVGSREYSGSLPRLQRLVGKEHFIISSVVAGGTAPGDYQPEVFVDPRCLTPRSHLFTRPDYPFEFPLTLHVGLPDEKGAPLMWIHGKEYRLRDMQVLAEVLDLEKQFIEAKGHSPKDATVQMFIDWRANAGLAYDLAATYKEFGFARIGLVVRDQRCGENFGHFFIELPDAKEVSQPGVPPLRVRLTADAQGRLARIELNGREMPTFKRMNDEVKRLLPLGSESDARTAQVRFDRHLRYDYLIGAVESLWGYLDEGGKVVRLVERIELERP